MTIRDWLSLGTSILDREGITSARLDAQLLLGEALKMDRAELLAHDDKKLTQDEEGRLAHLLATRLTNKPVAQISGRKEFYGHEFKINEDVLTPRPESEAIIDYALTYAPHGARLLDVGTGSGALAVALKLERRDLGVTAVDNSDEALRVARDNAARLDADISFSKSDLFSKVSGQFDLIVANLPYLTPDQLVDQPELAHEPTEALVSGEDGLDHYRRFLSDVKNYLAEGGLVLIEHVPDQFESLVKLAKRNQLELSQVSKFVSCLRAQ